MSGYVSLGKVRLVVSVGRDGSVSTATRYGLDGPGIESVGVRVSTPVQTGPGAHPVFYKVGSFP
jgi:hypothetical protein